MKDDSSLVPRSKALAPLMKDDLINMLLSLPVEERAKILKSLMQDLPPNEKAEVVNEAIKTSELTVVLGGNNWTTADVAVQIQNVNNGELATVFDALAYRIRKDRTQEKPEN